MLDSTVQCGSEIIDGVHRHSRTGIRVVIVGAGVAGLMAALECWRKGHEVQVLEKAECMSLLGDGFIITPSGLSTLDQYPEMKIAYHKHIYDSIITMRSWAGKSFRQTEADWNGAKDSPTGTQPVSLIKSRPEFAQMMLDQAARLGIPVFWGRKVTTYKEDIMAGEALVRTESGEVFTGDIVIAADGVGTNSHNIVNGNSAKLEHSGYSVVRAAYPTESVASTSLAASLLPKINARPRFDLYLGDHCHLILMCQEDWIGIAYTEQNLKNNTQSITKEALLERMTRKGNLDPVVIDLIQQIPSETKIVDWKLMWRDPSPQWVSKSGRIVQAGDAAHSFLPSSGNGATQALEDGVTIAECLRLGGKDQAVWSTRVYQHLCFERVSLIQKTGFTNRERMHNIYRILDQIEAGSLPKGMDMQFYDDWIWKHDPEKYATENYQGALKCLQDGDDFKNTNIPANLKYEPWTSKELLKELRVVENAMGIPVSAMVNVAV